MSLPRNLRPMRFVRRPEPFDSDDYVYELKIDGFRALAHIAGGHGELTLVTETYSEDSLILDLGCDT